MLLAGLGKPLRQILAIFKTLNLVQFSLNHEQIGFQQIQNCDRLYLKLAFVLSPNDGKCH